MTYARDEEYPFKKSVETALEHYRDNINDCAAGYDIIRYAARSLIQVDSSVDPNIFVEWYPLNQGYVLLRLAKDGKLSYKQKEKM